MIKLLLEPVNVLILDEPTNHLDMRTKDIIKDALKVFEFGNKRVKEHFENITNFMANKKMESLREIEKF